MTNLKETAWSVAKEYARQVAELLDLNPQDCYWVGSDNDERKTIDVCDMGTGTLFLTLDEIQTIIDRLPEWIARYGSREAVADEINDWNEWWLQDATDITEAARQRTLRPLAHLLRQRHPTLHEVRAQPAAQRVQGAAVGGVII